MPFTPDDFQKLEKLREIFLSPKLKENEKAYWNAELLSLYDESFGRRIAWKWDWVLGQLRARNWTPPAGRLVDWGCGSGVGTESLVQGLKGIYAPTSLEFYDHAKDAIHYCEKKFSGGSIPVGRFNPALTGGTLLISHVLGELSDKELGSLIHAADRFQAIIVVEAGTVHHFEKLRSFREALIGKFRAVAPCTHQLKCPAKPPHWCHNFAEPPNEVFHDAGWREFSKFFTVDLRTLPLSFLVLDRAGTTTEGAWTIGHPRIYKGYLKALSCFDGKLEELTLQKRTLPDLFKKIDKKQAGPLFKWEQKEGKITGLAGHPAPSDLD